MSAQEHRAAARAHERQAAEHRAQYDPKRTARATRPFGLPVVRKINADSDELAHQEYGYSEREYNPTEIHREQGAVEARHAEEHRRNAHELESFTEAQCRLFPPRTRQVCPLPSVAAEVRAIATGVEFELRPNVNPDAAVAHMRCHHAFGRERHFEGMDSCPLYLADITIALTQNRRAVRITSASAAIAREIQRRARTREGTESRRRP